MMLVNTLRAEWTKLSTTRSFWLTSAVFFLLTWGWSALIASTTRQTPETAMFLSPESSATAVWMLGLPVLMIQSIMIITTEYRYNIQTNVYMANPNRPMVAVVKLVMYAVISALLVFLAVVGVYLLTQAIAGDVAPDYDPWNSESARRFLWVYPLVMAAMVVFSQGMGLLLRQTAGTVAICLILNLGIDQLISQLPKIGEHIAPFMPFTALQNWIFETVPGKAVWDANWMNLVIFLLWAGGLWLLGVFLLHKRDA